MRGTNVALFAAVSAVIICSTATTVHAQVAVGTVLGERSPGDLSALVVMDNGDVYRSDYSHHDTGPQPQGPWALAFNIFTAGGPRSRVAGVGGGGVVLTAGGGTYRLDVNAGGALFDGIIDHQLGESFVAIGVNASINGCHIFAATDAGRVYRAWIGCGPSGWEYAGTLPTGPTPATRTSWGLLKSAYR